MTRDFQLRVKTLDESGQFVGVASTYGPPADLQGDIVEAGAFKQSIQHQGKGFPLLWCHAQSEPLGLAKISDGAGGLMVEGSLLMSDPAAKRALDHLKAGSIKGLSIGYSVPRGEGKVSYSDDGTRTLKEIHLYEISLCAVPANPQAMVTSVKTLGDVQRVLSLMKAEKVTDEVLDDLREIDRELKRLLVTQDAPAEDTIATLAALKDLARELRQ
jgi:HK97 family phage prohead protease